jgi:hypothetical protein
MHEGMHCGQHQTRESAVDDDDGDSVWPDDGGIHPRPGIGLYNV